MREVSELRRARGIGTGEWRWSEGENDASDRKCVLDALDYSRPAVHRGRVRTRVIASITAKTLKPAIRENVDDAAVVNTDGLPSYNGLRQELAAHEVVEHRAGEYARGKAHTNTVEWFFAIVKRGLNGVYHNVSKAHLHRYLHEFEFRHNGRAMNDGQRVVAAIRAAEGKRLMYRGSVAKPAPVVPRASAPPCPSVSRPCYGAIRLPR